MIAEREDLSLRLKEMKARSPDKQLQAPQAGTAPPSGAPPGLPPPPQPQIKAERHEGEQPLPVHLHLRVDERAMATVYCNAFRTLATAEEVFLDFGLAEAHPVDGAPGAVEVRIRAEARVAMSLYSAKRLALVLGKLTRLYEERFGPMDVKTTNIRLWPPKAEPTQ